MPWNICIYPTKHLEFQIDHNTVFTSFVRAHKSRLDFLLFFENICIETPEDDWFMIETCSVSNINKVLCLTETILEE